MDWPDLKLADWEDTYRTLHMWLQVVGKIRLSRATPENHCWHVVLYVTPRGLTTSNMPGGLEVRFDFLSHRLVIEDTAGKRREMALEPMTVAEFYSRAMALLAEMGHATRINVVPQEVGNPVRFDEDTRPGSYHRDSVERMQRVLVAAESVMRRFRGRFNGKCSPVHLFWGAFDMAVTRFSGRLNPSPPASPAWMRDAYSHEVISHGFWLGGDWPTGGRLEDAAFYAYAVPEPVGFRDTRWSYDTRFSEYLLPYASVRASADPEGMLMSFFEDTWQAGSRGADWGRGSS